MTDFPIARKLRGALLGLYCLLQRLGNRALLSHFSRRFIIRRGAELALRIVLGVEHGLLINASTQQPFTYKDPCVELNPHVGHDAAATEAVKTSVKAILKTVLKL